MKTRIALFSALMVCFFCSSCACHRYRDTNRKITASLQVGMEREQVILSLGLPDKREVYGDSEYLIYHTDCGNMNNERLNITPVLLENGKVTGWGRNYFVDIKRSKMDADINIRHQ